ncbi:hypothetical protein ACH427_04460 [Streptomyces sp. NPDC020379]|uniref:hypothetical protein n=1 Tax=Streptomyces sp. NPDC020379 TaxID=3365071 RepID=UPI0037959619
MTFDEATGLLASLKAGDRISLLDPGAVNYPGRWNPYFVLDGEQATLPYVPVCRNRQHTRIYMRVWEHIGFIANLCACELAAGRKQLKTWVMPEDAKHIVSATGFKDRATNQTWQSTQCGVLLETTGGRRWGQGHLSYPMYGHHEDRITCPGCRLSNGLEI